MLSNHKFLLIGYPQVLELDHIPIPVSINMPPLRGFRQHAREEALIDLTVAILDGASLRRLLRDLERGTQP